jgi:prevent-host-death family protein
MKVVNALSLRRKFGEVIDGVCRDKEPVMVTRANKPMVVIISHEEYKKLAQKNEAGKRLTRVLYDINKWSNEQEDKLRGLNAVEIIREIRQGK